MIKNTNEIQTNEVILDSETIFKVELTERYMGKLGHNCDLLIELTKICQKYNIKVGRIEAIGAVKCANLAYYDQTIRKYLTFFIDKPLEITKLIGNISIFEEKAFVHAHITLADKDGNCYGGHLSSGTIVYACEFILESYKGHLFERSQDNKTGLNLWK